jgi:hypothetical protein
MFVVESEQQLNKLITPFQSVVSMFFTFERISYPIRIYLSYHYLELDTSNQALASQTNYVDIDYQFGQS